MKTDRQELTESDQRAEKKADGKKHTGSGNSKLRWLLAALSPLLVYGFFLLVFQRESSIGDWIMLSVSALVFYFVMLVSIQEKTWRFHQERHKERFAIVFLAGVLATILFSFASPLLWLYLPLSVAMVLCSDLPQAFSGYLLLLFLQTLLSGADLKSFLTFAMIGCIGILMFSFLDDRFLFGVPLFCSLLFQTLLLSALAVLSLAPFTILSAVMIAGNLLVCFLLLTGLLKYMSLRVIHKAIDQYAELNDPENALLSKLKEISQRSYYHAVHTAHFCEKLAELIGADAPLCKAGGYYHKIGRLLGESSNAHTMQIAKENAFPPKLCQILREYGMQDKKIRSREAAILLLSDAMVSSVMFLFDKNKEAKLDYGQIVEVVFSKQMESGCLDTCRLTMEELWTIKKSFKEETLYYDFLR